MKIINRSLLKLFIYNFSFLIVFLMFTPIIYYGARAFKKFGSSNVEDNRQFLPPYENNILKQQIFKDWENRKGNYEYLPFIDWKQLPYTSETLNVGGIYNLRKSFNQSLVNSTWFFGGSTMWGEGSEDFGTIPSHYAKITNTKVLNFGEGSWVSRQSLNKLINVLGDGFRPKSVVFYDGFNDIYMQCFYSIKDNHLPNHTYGNTFKKVLDPVIKKENILINNLKDFYLLPYKSIAKKLNKKEDVKNKICEDKNKFSDLIANHLINNWRAAHALSKTYGFKFYAILQPYAFSAKNKVHYLEDNQYESKKSLENIYSLIIKKKDIICSKLSDTDFCNSIIDGSKWLSGDQPYFIDIVHISSDGNKLISEKFASLSR